MNQLCLKLLEDISQGRTPELRGYSRAHYLITPGSVKGFIVQDDQEVDFQTKIGLRLDKLEGMIASQGKAIDLSDDLQMLHSLRWRHPQLFPCFSSYADLLKSGKKQGIEYKIDGNPAIFYVADREGEFGSLTIIKQNLP